MKKFNLAAVALVVVAELVNNGTGLAGDRHSAGVSNGGGRSGGNAGFQMPAQSRGASPVQGGGNRVLGAANLSHSQVVPQSPLKTAPVTTSPIRTAPPVKVTQPSVGGQNTGAGEGRKIFVPPAQTTGGRIGLPPIHPAQGNQNGGNATTTPAGTGGQRIPFPGFPGHRDGSGTVGGAAGPSLLVPVCLCQAIPASGIEGRLPPILAARGGLRGPKTVRAPSGESPRLALGFCQATILLPDTADAW